MLPLRPPHILTFMQRTRDIATCMYYTGVDPLTKQEVYIARVSVRPTAWLFGRRATSGG